jgi:hypothetical protein
LATGKCNSSRKRNLKGILLGEKGQCQRSPAVQFRLYNLLEMAAIDMNRLVVAGVRDGGVYSRPQEEHL